MSEHTVSAFLAEHPRFAGVLFTITLLLFESGIAAAGAGGSTTTGP